MVRIVCIAGATTGATGLLFDGDLGLVAAVKGRGLLPVEQDENALYLRVQEICNSLAVAAPAIVNEPTDYVFSLSVQMGPSYLEAIRSAINHSKLKGHPATLTTLTRGEACWWASGASDDTVVVKVGTVGFAHAFSKSYPREPRSWRAGGWGLLSGDDGGAYFIGRSILYRLFEEQDGRRPQTAFSHSFAELMRERDTFGVMSWIQQHRDTHSLRVEVSRLAQTASFLAEQQADEFCLRLLRRAAERLAGCLSAAVNVARKDCDDFGADGIIALVQGRLVQFSLLYAQFLSSAIRRRCASLSVRVRLQPLTMTPVLGCLLHSLVANQRWSRADAGSLARAIAAQHSSLAAEFSPQVTKNIMEAVE